MDISNAIDPSARARALGIKTDFKNLFPSGAGNLPMRIAILAEPDWLKRDNNEIASEPRQIINANEAGQIYGYGSHIHLIAKQLFPDNGNGVGSITVTVYPVMDTRVGGDPPSGGLAAQTDPGGNQVGDGQYIVTCNGISTPIISVPDGTLAADFADIIGNAINATLDMPVRADTGSLEDIYPKSYGPGLNDYNVTYTKVSDTGNNVTNAGGPTSYATDLDVTSPLEQMAEDWETLVITSLNIGATQGIADVATFNETRWNPQVYKPFIAFIGSNATAIPAEGAGTDAPAQLENRTFSQLVAPGSVWLPMTIAAAQLVRIATIANENPPQDYGSQPVPAIPPGSDSDQWDYDEQDAALKRGSSTIKVVDGIVKLSDTVTFFHPDGEEDPAYRYVCDIIKVMQVIYQLEAEFAQPKWDGAPLIPNNQATTNRNAKKPKDAIGAISAIIDALALNAVLSDPATAKASIVAAINSTNPKRLDVAFTVQLSGNTNIVSIDLNFGFYFGSAA